MRTRVWHLTLAGLVAAATAITGATGTAVGRDTPSPDTALPDTASPDTASPDTPSPDAPSPDAPSPDTVTRDTPPSDIVTLGVPGRANAFPWVAADGQFVAIVWGVSAGEKRSDVMLAVSRDGGATFATPVRVNREPGTARLGGELPPRVALAPGAAADPDVIVLWNSRAERTSIEVARSRDGGRTFDAPRSLVAPDAAGDRGWPSLATDRRGVAHAIWLDHRGLAAAKATSGGGHHPTAGHAAGAAKPTSAVAAPGATGAPAAHVHGASAHGAPGQSASGRSASGHGAVGQSASGRSGPGQRASGQSGSGDGTSASAAAATSKATASHAAPMDGVAMAQRSSLYYANSASPAAGGQAITPGVCYCCKTALAVGRDGELFAAWRHVYPGNVRDIAFAVSRDSGRTFDAPIKVSADHWEINGCPDDGPAMAVAADGTVHIVWPTVVGEGDEMRGALFYASSRDGRRFGARQRIPTGDSLKPMHPQIAMDASGQVLVAWDEFIAGNRRVARVARLVRPDTFGAPLTLGGSAPADDAQYPILAASSRGLLAVWTRGAQGATTIAVRRVSVPTS